ncbi:hypothetical protein LUZ60_000315 [Juncus effusus]|nr:hypothetical protein LUZ60_000315 [Juncus effusus]
MRVGLLAESGSQFGDLLCGEDFEVLDDSVECKCITDPDEFPSDSDESIASFIVLESVSWCELDYLGRIPTESVDPLARSEVVSWILKVQKYYHFQPVTGYLAINYLDRFLSSHDLPEDGWALQLVCVACLSLAAKMEETIVPSLLDLQVEGTKFIFEPRTIRRMEFLVLTALDWRLRFVTPFSFIDFFTCKADPSGKHTRNLVSRASEFILESIHDMEFLVHCPSSMAAGALLCAIHEASSPSLAFITPYIASTWCAGLSMEAISRCYKSLQKKVFGSMEKKRPLTFDSGSGVSSKRRMLHKT